MIKKAKLRVFCTIVIISVFLQLFISTVNVTAEENVSFEIKDISVFSDYQFAFTLKNTGNVAINIKYGNALYVDSELYAFIRYRYKSNDYLSFQIPTYNIVIEPNEEKQIINKPELKIDRDFTLKIIIRDLDENILVSKEESFQLSDIYSEQIKEFYDLLIIIAVILLLVVLVFFMKKKATKKKIERKKQQLQETLNEIKKKGAWKVIKRFTEKTTSVNSNEIEKLTSLLEKKYGVLTNKDVLDEVILIAKDENVREKGEAAYNKFKKTIISEKPENIEDYVDALMKHYDISEEPECIEDYVDGILMKHYDKPYNEQLDFFERLLMEMNIESTELVYKELIQERKKIIEIESYEEELMGNKKIVRLKGKIKEWKKEGYNVKELEEKVESFEGDTDKTEDKLLKCSSCGLENKPIHKFCQDCGTKLE